MTFLVGTEHFVHLFICQTLYYTTLTVHYLCVQTSNVMNKSVKRSLLMRVPFPELPHITLQVVVERYVRFNLSVTHVWFCPSPTAFDVICMHTYMDKINDNNKIEKSANHCYSSNNDNLSPPWELSKIGAPYILRLLISHTVNKKTKTCYICV